jgi:hypothetical protein
VQAADDLATRDYSRTRSDGSLETLGHQVVVVTLERPPRHAQVLGEGV